MNNRFLIPVVFFIMGGALAYFVMPTKVEIQTSSTQTQDTKVEQDTVIVEKTDKDGNKVKTTTIKTNTQTQTKREDKTVEVKENKKQQYHISAMAGVDVTNLTSPIVFGIHVQKQFIGPISIGLFGFTNKTAGLSLGLQF